MKKKNKYILHLSYLGTNYSGWQIQNNSKSVQGFIMKALHTIIDPEIPLIVGAGRTDKGVHAINFIAHFESYTIDVNYMKFKLNKFLPDDIVIHHIQLCLVDFHARYSSILRKYEYWICMLKDPFLINRAYFLNQDLDLELMNLAAKKLICKQDFSAFSKSKSENNICAVESAGWFKTKNMFIFSIEADRFLYNMVRCIVGTLINVGTHKLTLDDFSMIISSKDRTKAGYSVPACGLYLLDIKYPKKYNLESI